MRFAVVMSCPTVFRVGSTPVPHWKSRGIFCARINRRKGSLSWHSPARLRWDWEELCLIGHAMMRICYQMTVVVVKDDTAVDACPPLLGFPAAAVHAPSYTMVYAHAGCMQTLAYGPEGRRQGRGLRIVHAKLGVRSHAGWQTSINPRQRRRSVLGVETA